MSEIIEAAVTNYKLKDYGYDTGYEFQKRLSELQTKRMLELQAKEQSALNKREDKIDFDDEKNAQSKSLLNDVVIPGSIDGDDK